MLLDFLSTSYHSMFQKASKKVHEANVLIVKTAAESLTCGPALQWLEFLQMGIQKAKNMFKFRRS